MSVKTFDKIAVAAIILSVSFTIITATSWNWFPTPGDWGDIAQIPKSIKNYVALLLPPTITLAYSLTRRWCFK